MAKTYKKLQAEDWKRLDKEWLVSGLSQPDFCSQHGVKYTQFAYWRGKFLLESNDNKSRSTAGFSKVVSERNIKSSKQITGNLEPQIIKSSWQYKESSSLQIQLPTGVRVMLGKEVHEASLKQVLQLLGALA